MKNPFNKYNDDNPMIRRDSSDETEEEFNARMERQAELNDMRYHAMKEDEDFFNDNRRT